MSEFPEQEDMVRLSRCGSVAAVAAVLAGGLTGTATAQPTEDFYAPPAGYADTAPGTILRSRPVQLAALSNLPQRVDAWQLLYRTTSHTGAPMATVTTVLRPAGGAAKGLVSYQVAEDASAAKCAPSLALQRGSDTLDSLTGSAEVLLADAAVGNGFAVSVPDYEGPDSEFGAARQPGYAALDGVRAAERFAPLGLPGAATPVGLWGYSGGSLATGWAAQVQPDYAPELAVKGIAVGGFVTDLGQAITRINGGFGAGLIPSALPGVIRTDPAFQVLLDKYLTPAGKDLLAHSATQCVASNVAQYLFFDANRYLTLPLDQVLQVPEIRTALAGLNLGGSAPTAPLFVYHAVNDELIPIAGADSTVRKYCVAGDSVTYVRDLLSEHGSLAVTGAVGALSWLTQRLNGSPAATGCSTTTTLSSLLSPDSIRHVPAFLVSAVKALLGLPIGPKGIF